MTDQRVPAKVSGHMFTASSETDSSDGSNDGIVELNSEETQEGSPPPSTVPNNQDRVESDRSMGDSKRLKPVDMDGIVFGLPPPPGRCQLGTTGGADSEIRAPAIATAGNNRDRQCTDNFGIQYRPSHGPKQGYEIPSGPAFYDEDEFEQEMSAEFRVAAGVSGSGGQIQAATSSSGIEATGADEKCLVRPQQEKGVREFDEGAACRSGSQQPPGRRAVRATKDVASTTAFSSSEGDTSDGKKPIISSEEGVVKHPDPGNVMQLDNAEALRQLTDSYKKGGSSTTQLRTAENSIPMEKGVGGALQPVSINEGDRIVCTADVLRHFRSQDLDEHKASIVPFQPRQSRFGLFRRDPTLKFPEAEQLRNEVFLIAKILYSPKDVMHRRLIQTIYRRMTKEKRACPDVGPHWDTIGFQGTDPCTDLNRSMGVFSLLQVLYLLETQPAFAAIIFRYSTADVTGWPFLCVSIGFTKGAVDVLRQGACYAECNRRKSVMEVVHELHQAQFHAFLSLCRQQPATHHALHLAKVRTSTENDSPSLVKAYRIYLSDQKTRSATGVVGKTGGTVGHELLGFTGEETAQDSGKRLVSGSRALRYTTGTCQDDSGVAGNDD